MTSETVRVFIARDVVKKGEGGGDEHENITVHVVPLADVWPWLRARKRGSDDRR